MTAETQYVQDFKNRFTTDKGVLADMRRSAMESFSNLGFPNNKQEKWRNLDLTAFTGTPFSAVTRFQPTTYFDDLDFPYLSSARRMVFINGIFTPELSDLLSLPKGVIFTNLSTVIEQNPSLVIEQLHKSGESTEDAFNELNKAFMQTGVWLSIPDGLEEKIDLQIIYISRTGEDMPLFNLRNFIRLGQGSNLSLTEHYLGSGKGTYFNNAAVTMDVNANARLDYTCIQTESETGHHISNTIIDQATDSRVNSTVFTLGGALVRNNLTLNLNGEGASGNINGLYLNRAEQTVDNHTLINHAHPNCNSGEMYKGIIDEAGQAIFNGKIIVQPDAQKTDANQINRNLLLSDTARVNTNPQLEIYADDVKCSHGSTTGHLDEDALFYLRSRGINSALAQSLMINGFAREVIDTVESDNTRSLVTNLIDEWFSFKQLNQ